MYWLLSAALMTGACLSERAQKTQWLRLVCFFMVFVCVSLCVVIHEAYSHLAN